jgi:dATP pyrophosphohydrolase
LTEATGYRRPESVLVVVAARDGRVLLLRRAAPFDFWQSVTGSLKAGECHAAAARRELFEETGLADAGRLTYSGVARQFTIDPRWQDRYAPGIVENVEYEWLYLLDEACAIRLSAAEHSEYAWLPRREALARVWSWTNREALETLRI